MVIVLATKHYSIGARWMNDIGGGRTTTVKRGKTYFLPKLDN